MSPQSKKPSRRLETKKPSKRLEDVIEFFATVQEEDGVLFFEIPSDIAIPEGTVDVSLIKVKADPKFFCCLKKLGSEPPNGERED